MAERSSAGIAHALREGFARAASAPAIVAGVFVAARLLDVSPGDLSPLAAGNPRHVIVSLLFWSFVYGGALDRYARNRPTRAHGFFAACGAHVMALIRLGVVVLLFVLVLLPFSDSAWAKTPAGFVAIAIVLAAINLCAGFARIRLAVEDRRSAIGSLLAGIRFVRRNPAAAVTVYVVFAGIGFAASLGYAATVSPYVSTDMQRRIGYEALLALELFLQLAAYASGVVLFQSRLAHAAYTAAPPAVWPDSPAAEAVANPASGAVS